jgi:hypothetical protein
MVVKVNMAAVPLPIKGLDSELEVSLPRSLCRPTALTPSMWD